MADVIKVTLIKGISGKSEKQRKVLNGMGLTKTNKTVLLQDTPSIRGMVQKVSHLVRVEG